MRKIEIVNIPAVLLCILLRPIATLIGVHDDEKEAKSLFFSKCVLTREKRFSKVKDGPQKREWSVCVDRRRESDCCKEIIGRNPVLGDVDEKNGRGVYSDGHSWLLVLICSFISSFQGGKETRDLVFPRANTSRQP
jgi:hypothetical protein